MFYDRDLNPDTKQAVYRNVGMNPYLITNYDEGRYSGSSSNMGHGKMCPILGFSPISEVIELIGAILQQKRSVDSDLKNVQIRT
jgi:hypothetical protein